MYINIKYTYVYITTYYLANTIFIEKNYIYILI